MYQIYKEGLSSKPTFIPYPSKVPVKNKEKDYFVSLFQYTEEHKKLFELRGTLAGIKDVTTDKLYWDFDSKIGNGDFLEDARKDAIELINRLIEKNVDPDNILASFTGSKGFSVELRLAKRITNKEFKAAVQKLAGDLKTFDTVVSDPQRIVRLDNTKHQKSGNYKIPLQLFELDELSIPDIIAKSKTTGPNPNEVTPVNLESKLFEVKEEKNTMKFEADSEGRIPKGWKDYKWSLAQGNFESGERHQALMIVAATCRGLGSDQVTAYYICKSAIKKQAAITGNEEFPKDELYENIIDKSVYSTNWEGGQYSPKTNPWLAEYCKKMGFEPDDKDETSSPAISLHDMTEDFGRFAKDFDKNIIKTGIPELDAHSTLCVSTLNGLLGQPGAGKTSAAINYLLNTSKQGINSMFFSLDMGKQIVYAKLIQKETGLSFKESMDLFRNDPVKSAQVAEKLKNDYKNVGFNFRSGTSVADIRRSIKDQEELIGEKVKLVVVDYLECIQSSMSDPTAGGGLIAGQLKDVANEEEVCILLLLQTQKHSTPDIGDPLLSLKQVKGSSKLEQDCTSILTLWREGYSPKYVNDDKYISFAVVKNRFGPLWSGDFKWDGLRGDIRSLADEERDDLKEFRKRKREEKAAVEAHSNKGWE